MRKFSNANRKLCVAVALFVITALVACNQSNASTKIQSDIQENITMKVYTHCQSVKSEIELVIIDLFTTCEGFAVEKVSEEQKHEIIRPLMVALTFDDGPSAYTNKILDLLERYDGRSTFFVSGPRMLANTDTVLRAFEMGNEIANHSWSHQDMRLQSEYEIIYELQRASAAITYVTGMSPPIFRPPFGMSDERVMDISTELGYSIIKWTVDPLDWRYRDADIVYYSIMSQVENDSIILVHDTRPTTADAMERVIPQLIERGFQLVTVSELLYSAYGKLEPGRVYGSYTILD